MRQPGIRLTPRAVEDLKSIGRYTQGRWGREQRNRYLEALDARFAWLAANPGLGRHRDDVRPGYRCFAQGQHLIFYVECVDGIAIIGIPHQAMDPNLHVRDND
jgi:toxin ParE1/3/4